VEAAVALWRRMAGAGVERTPGALGALLGACRAALQGERALALLAEARAAGAGRAQPGPLLPAPALRRQACARLASIMEAFELQWRHKRWARLPCVTRRPLGRVR